MKLYHKLIILFIPTLTQSKTSPTICLEKDTCFLGSWALTDKGNKFASFQGSMKCNHARFIFDSQSLIKMALHK